MADQMDPILQSIEATKAEYVRLGNSGLRVSVPIFGTMSLGSKAWQPWAIEEQEALPLLKAAFDRGINTWDTANVYSNGVGEEIIGRAIKKYDIPREKLVLLTKCSSYVGDSPGSKAFMYRDKCYQSKDLVNQGGLSRKAIFSAVDASLKRMDVNYIDLLQIHRYDQNTPIEETLDALHDLIKIGKVRYIGASSMWAYQFATLQFCAEKHGWTKFISMQNQYNLLYREDEREMVRLCNETGVGIIPWSPLCRGHLARPLSTSSISIRATQEKAFKVLQSGHTDNDQKIIQRVHELSEKKGWSMTMVALTWIKKRVASPVVGFNNVDRMDEALSARDKVLSEDEEKYLEELYVPRDVQGHS